MGNNFQALQTAKALTKQISSNEHYVTTNGAKDVEIPRRLNSRPSLSPTAVAGVTLKPSSHRSDSGVKDLMTNGSKNEYIYQNGSSFMNHDSTNPFVYYLPQTNGVCTQPQDESIQDKIDAQRHVTETSRMVTSQAEMTYTTQAQTIDQAGTRQPVFVDLTLDDSDDNDDQQNISQPENTFPKILAAYSLNENSSFPNLSSFISSKVKESQENNIVVDSLVLNTTNPNGSFIESTSLNLNKPYKTVETSTLNMTKDTSPSPLISAKPYSTVQPNFLRTKPNGSFLDNRVKTCDSHDEITTYPKNGIRSYSNDVSTRVLTNHVRSGNVRNDVMHDVTNTHGAQSYEYRPLLFSSWSKTTETLSPVTTRSDAEDNVVITKVVTPTDSKSRDRPKQRRKAPIQVRQWCESTEKTPVPNGGSQLCSSKGALDVGQKDTETSAQRSTTSPKNLHREAKIRTLKNLLAKQEKAIQKMRTQDNSKCSLVPTDRMLVVEIPDLKSELHLPNAEKHSFRVYSKTITISPKDDSSPRKRPRKRDPRKIDRYPSYVEASDDDDHAAIKRFKGKQKAGRKSRGRNSPKPTNQIPLVLKDLWHRELEKVEQQLALSGGPVDQTSFMMFLGLKKV